MKRIRIHESHRLPNMSFGAKLVSTLGLLIGLSIFVLSWVYLIVVLNWSTNEKISVQSWAASLSDVAWRHTDVYLILWVAHTAALLAFFAVTSFLTKRSSIRARLRVVLRLATRALLAFDVLSWALPFIGAFEWLSLPIAVAAASSLFAAVLLSLMQMWVYARWSNPSPKRVIVVGGGFAGLDAAMGLDKKLGYHKDLEIILFDRKNFFLFPPLLPSTATGTIETRQVTFPFRRIFETTNIVFKKASVERIDTKKNTITARIEAGLDSDSNEVEEKLEEISYDYLILAPGSENQTFNTPGAETYSFFMKELGDAIEIRNQVIDCFERAAACESEQLRRELLGFAVVGAGPTGLEVATEIHDLVYHVLLKRYPEINADEVSISVLQGGNQILAGWNESVVAMARKQLSKLKINLIFGARVSEVGLRHISFKDGRKIVARTCVWCAGVKPSGLLQRSDLVLDKSGRAVIGETLLAEGLSNVFVLGDSAYLVDKKSGKPLPPLGQVAFQQGAFMAAQILRALRGQALKPFKYFNFGALVSVGEHFACVDLIGVRFSGFLGWVVWRSLYLAKLVGFSNKVRVLIDWTLDLLIERSFSQIKERRIMVQEREATLISTTSNGRSATGVSSAVN